MAKQFNLYEAKPNLSELVNRASAGEEIVIAKSGKPMARLVPLAKPKGKVAAMFGKNVTGIRYLTPDFEDHLPLELFLGDGKVDPERVIGSPGHSRSALA